MTIDSDTKNPKRRRQFSWPRLAAGLASAVATCAAMIAIQPALARVSPVNYIEHQIHKPNLMIMLDTSGSMTGVPGGSFRNSSEVGVDCDNGLYCRGWGLTGECSQTRRPCSADGDCAQRYCTLGMADCASDADCPSDGRCRQGAQVCAVDGDCTGYGYGTCEQGGAACSAQNACPTVGRCSQTGDLCTDTGRRCDTGLCSNNASRLCLADSDCRSASTGSCRLGRTPSGGCRADVDCPAAGVCSTGESCTTVADCPAITTGTCSSRGNSCRNNGDCRRSETCNLPTNRCTLQTNSCEFPTGTCQRSNQNRCNAVSNRCQATANPCDIINRNSCQAPPAESCTPSATAGQGALKMCQLAQSLCNSNADCRQAGDSCGPPTSRSVVAKRTLTNVINDNSNIVNFGFMTFYQSGYFPYYETRSGTPQIERIFITKGFLEGPCWSHAGGPTRTCSYQGADYTLVSGNNSRYRTRGGRANREEIDTAWCGQFCAIPGEGTGRYLGSYYERTFSVGTVTSTRTVMPTYTGKNITANGKNYRYYDSRPDYYNSGTAPPISVANCNDSCSASCGARWDTQLASFLQPNATAAQAEAMRRQILAWMEPASQGGLIMYGGTPSGCALENNTTQSEASSAYHYMAAVKRSDTLACRQNYVVFITDGEANGPGDSSCSSTACGAADPAAAGCTCRVVLAAWRMRQNLGVRTFVVGFSSDIAVGTARAANDNVAKAGGTDQGNDNLSPFAFVATNEEELQAAIQGAIYDAVRGTYSTSPATASSGEQLSNSIRAGKYALDARVDFPSWKGHLLAYDVTASPPAVAWDAALEMEKVAWWKRRIYLGAHDGSVVKVRVDPITSAVLNQDVIHELGLGADAAEAGRMMRFIMGDPAMGNPAILGSMINSTPIDVSEPGDSPMPGGHAFFVENKDRPSITYVGADDGMLHAFFTDEVSVGGLIYPAGTEAFAYIPPGMLSVIASLYVQKGQLADPAQHIYGLANSPKVKNLCVSGCASGTTAVWKTLLVMNEGYGGDGVFMLDITNPVGAIGFADPPVRPVWHSQSPALQSDYAQSLGMSISVPAFYFNKTDTLDDYRVILASGYPMPGGAATQGRRLVTADAVSGQIFDTETTSPSGSCAQEYALLSDVVAARDYSTGQYQKLRAAYVGDTWGNLWRYGGSALTRLKGFGCQYPLHFSPTVVQLDRDDAGNHAGEAYIVQVTNSALDDATIGFPASRMVIMREIIDSGGAVTLDSNFGQAGEIVLTAGNNSQICGVTNSAGGCTQALPTTARPTATPMAILKKDGSGFQLISMWYAPDTQGCSKGATWLALHEVIGNQVTQVQGLKVANEPVTSPVVVGGRIFVVGSEGTIEITGNLEATFSTGNSTPTANVGAGIYQKLNWVEIEE